MGLSTSRASSPNHPKKETLRGLERSRDLPDATSPSGAEPGPKPGRLETTTQSFGHFVIRLCWKPQGRRGILPPTFSYPGVPMALNSKRAKPYAFPLRSASQTRSEYLPVPIYPSLLLSTYLFSFSATKDKNEQLTEHVLKS